MARHQSPSPAKEPLGLVKYETGFARSRFIHLVKSEPGARMAKPSTASPFVIVASGERYLQEDIESILLDGRGAGHIYFSGGPLFTERTEVQSC